MRFVRKHLKRVAISAGIASIGWNFILLSDSGLWRTWLLIGITFSLLAACMYFIIGAFWLLGRTQTLSDRKVAEAHAVLLSDGFSDDPAEKDWREADRLFREALRIEPTSSWASERRAAFIWGTLQRGAVRFGTEVVADLPDEYRKLSGDLERVDARDYLQLRAGVGSDSVTHRVRRFFVSTIGGLAGTKSNWIVGLIATTLVVTPYVLEDRAEVESALASKYRSVCESILGDCGGKIRGYDKVDAFDAAKVVLINRYPMHTATGYRDAGISCWEYAEDSEVVVWARADRGHFELFFGERQGAGRGPDADTWVEETSRWLVTPPISKGEWTVSVEREPFGLEPGYTCAE